MAIQIETPVSVIEGIGPAASAALAQIRVHTVVDLVRTRPEPVHEAVRAHASMEEVLSWRRMAALLELAEVTPQWAEALVQGGIGTIDGLRDASFEQVQAAMHAAHHKGIIPSEPQPAQIAAMMRDAGVVSHSGALTGTVLDAALQRVPNAVVRVGPMEGRTDERGRFRLLRLPLGRAMPLRIEHPQHPSFADPAPRIARSASAVAPRVFRLPAPPSAHAAIAAAASGSELDGDELPVPQGQTVRQAPVEVGDLRPGDILMVRHSYASSTDVQLVSRLKSYENGEFIVRTVRLPASDLPQPFQLRDHFGVSPMGFVRLEMTRESLRRYKIRCRLWKFIAGRPAPGTAEEKEAEFMARYHFLRNAGYWTARWKGEP
jgi:hypothetical protein